MNQEKLKKYYKEKVFLIGLTFLNKEGTVIEQYQTHGTFSELTDSGIIKISKLDKSIFHLPYDKETIKKAEKGDYKEKTTGIVVKNPDFIVMWEITIRNIEDINQIMKHGYIQPKEN
jgi:hypothetical protein